MRIAATFAVIFAWLFATNHCALAMPSAGEPKCHAQPAKAHSHESGHGDHQNDGDDHSGQSCCKSLQAPALQLAKSPLHFDANAFALALDFADYTLTAHLASPASIEPHDTGPPGLISFAESVLQRSLLAHAPPSLG